MVATANKDGRRERRRRSEARLVAAVGEVVAERGVDGLGVNAVADKAGVDKVLIYRYFGGLSGLLRKYGESIDFWPTLDECLGPGHELLQCREPAAFCRQYLANYLDAMLRRPVTIAVLAFEPSGRNELTVVLEEVREAWSTALVEYLTRSALPLSRELVVAVTSLTASIHYLLIRAHGAGGAGVRVFGGMNIGDRQGWDEILDVWATMVTPFAAPDSE